MITGSVSPINVIIRDFQSIKEINIDIAGFTAITGKSNIGKSAIIRSIYSSLVNGPVGGLVNKNAVSTSVIINNDNWGFKWEKGGGLNRYTIGSEVFDKVGAGQFELIRNIGFGSVKLGDKEVYPWCASQFKPVFLLDETGPSLSDFISDVSRLNVLQEAVNINVRNKKKFIDLSKNKLEEIENDKELLKSLDGLDDLANLETDIECQIKSISELEEKISSMEIFFLNLENNANKIRKLSDISNVIFNNADLDNQFSIFEELSSIWCSLDKVAKSIISIKGVSSISIPELYDEEYEKIEIIKKFEHYNLLKDSIDKLSNDFGLSDFDDSHFELFKNSDAMLTNMNFVNNEIRKNEKDLKFIDIDIKQIQKELLLIPVCPTCERPIVDQHVDHP